MLPAQPARSHVVDDAKVASPARLLLLRQQSTKTAIGRTKFVFWRNWAREHPCKSQEAGWETGTDVDRMHWEAGLVRPDCGCALTRPRAFVFRE
jgi:hypothetical protein